MMRWRRRALLSGAILGALAIACSQPTPIVVPTATLPPVPPTPTLPPRPTPSAIPRPTARGRVSPVPAPAPPAGIDAATVVLTREPEAALAPLFLGLETGLFEAARLLVHLRVDEPDRALASVALGRDDFAITSAERLVAAHLNGLELVSVLALDAPTAGRYAHVLVTRRGILNERRAIVDRFVSVTVAGCRLATVNPGAAIDAIAMARGGVERAALERDMEAQIRRWTSLDPPGLQHASGFGGDGLALGRGAPFDNGPALAAAGRPPTSTIPSAAITPTRFARD